MKNQKTIIGMLLVLVLMLSFALTACGGNETPTTTLKPSTTTQPGDKLEISMGPRVVAVEVLQVADNVRKDDAVTMYKEI